MFEYSEILTWESIVVSRKRPIKLAIKFTHVSWALSLEETSARLFLIAWCWVKADLVAPPATPTIAFMVVVPHKMYVATSGNLGRQIISIPMAISFRISARILHFFESKSRSQPFHHANKILPRCPVPSLSTHVIVADSGFTKSDPTPTPLRIACVVRVPIKKNHICGNQLNLKCLLFGLLQSLISRT